jgi:hypothetical protein
LIKTNSFATLLETAITIAFLGLLVALVLLQANPLTTLPSRDGGIYAYFGRIILEGKLPYIYAWDSKPPGLFYLNALALWLGRGTRWGIWLMEYIFLLAATVIGYKLMRNLWRSGAAIFGTIIWLLGLNAVLSGGNYTEEYPLLFNFLALYCFWKSLQNPENKIYDFFTGLTLALSFLFRANNIGVQITIILTWCIVLLVGKDITLLLKKVALMLGAALLLISGVCAYFWAKGALYPMIEAALLYNFYYTGGHANLWSGIKNGFEYLGPIAWVALAGYLITLWHFILSYRLKTVDNIALLLMIGWPVEIVLAALSGRGYGHYYISWLPMIALLCGMLFSELARQILPGIIKFLNARVKYALLILVAVSAVIFRGGLVSYWDSFSRILFDRRLGIENTPPIAQYVRNNTDPGDRVLVWGGQMGINLMSHRDSPTASIIYPLYVDSPFTAKMEARFLSDIENQPPAMIIDAYIHDPDNVLSLNPDVRSAQIAAGKGEDYQPPNLAQVFDFIQSHYKLEVVIGDYSVYKFHNP